MKKSAILNQHNTMQPLPVQPKTLRDCSRLLQQLGRDQAVLQLKQLQSFWLSVMADKGASYKDRLQASRLYADSIGAFDSNKQNKGVNGALLHWKKPIDADVIPAK